MSTYRVYVSAERHTKMSKAGEIKEAGLREKRKRVDESGLTLMNSTLLSSGVSLRNSSRKFSSSGRTMLATCRCVFVLFIIYVLNKQEMACRAFNSV